MNLLSLLFSTVLLNNGPFSQFAKASFSDSLCSSNPSVAPLNCNKFQTNNVCRFGVKDYDSLKIFPERMIDTVTEFDIKSINGKYCDCGESPYIEEGFTGVDCGLVYAVCDNFSVCLHGSVCMQDIDSSKSVCDCSSVTQPPDVVFTGDSCEYAVTDWCDENSGYDISENGSWYCTNGGKCRDSESDPTAKCDCEDGFYGLHCEQNEEKNCPLQCANGGVCKHGVKDTSFYGKSDPSLDQYMSSQGTYETHCVCPQGFTGRICETKISKCGYGHCLNDAECINNDYCDCSSAVHADGGLYTALAGRACESKSTISCPAPEGSDDKDYFCTNHGRCPENPHEPCRCDPQYSGARCEFFKETEKKCDFVCQNGGTCFFGTAPTTVYDDMTDIKSSKDETPTEMHCKCPEGYAGDNCETKIEICGASEHHCLNGGECFKENDLYSCDCTKSYSNILSAAGSSCQYEATTYCETRGKRSHSFCTNNGVCMALSDSDESEHPGCTCSSGFYGNFCEKKREHTGNFGPASKAFMGFTIALFGIVGIFFLVVYVNSSGSNGNLPDDMPVDYPDRNFEEESDNTMIYGM